MLIDSHGSLKLRPSTDNKQLTMSLVGDINLGQGIEERLVAGQAAFSEEIAGLLVADLVVGNLEGPQVTKATVNPERGGMKCRAELSAPLFELGFTHFNLANNHTMDCGADGMRETLDLLRQRGVANFGAGENLEAACKLVTVERKGLRLGFLGFSQPELDSATMAGAGVAPLHRQVVLDAVRAAQKQVDLLILSLHEGYEFSDVPRLDFYDFCHELVDEEGVRVIYGHHPHVPHGIEVRGESLILYSVGNFAFDLTYHRAHTYTRHSVIVKLELDSEGCHALRLEPVVLTAEHLLRPATATERQDILDHVLELSRLIQDRRTVADRNREFVEKVMSVVLDAPWQAALRNNRQEFERFCRSQIHRWPYAKVFCDFSEQVVGYQRLSQSPRDRA